MGRRVALLLSVLLLLVGCDHARTPGTQPRETSVSPSSPGFAPPAGHRWAGLRGVVVAVPTRWRSIENPFCQRPPTHTVVYFNPLNLAGACPYMSMPPGPPPSYVQIQDTTSTRGELKRARPIMIGDLQGYARNYPRYHSAEIRVPARHLAFFINTPRPALAGRIIASVTQVPTEYRVIPKPPYASHQLDAMMARLRSQGFRTTYAEEPPGNTEYGYPGRFIRTEPPIGSAVKRGARVTAYFSSGRLDAWITDRRLGTAGWSVRPPSSFTPPVTRDAALAALDRAPDERAAFLRTLTIGHHTRQAWLVVDQPHYASPGQAVTLAAVDARTGRVWMARTRFPATG